MITPTERYLEKWNKNHDYATVVNHFWKINYPNREIAARELYNYMHATGLRPRVLRGCQMMMGMHYAEYLATLGNVLRRQNEQRELEL